ncbi:hypothetical protein DFAR_2690032 [Desulfarculales bacterium]
MWRQSPPGPVPTTVFFHAPFCRQSGQLAGPHAGYETGAPTGVGAARGPPTNDQEYSNRGREGKPIRAPTVAVCARFAGAEISG